MGVFLELGTLNLELLIDMFAHANSIYLRKGADSIFRLTPNRYALAGEGENTLLPNP